MQLQIKNSSALHSIANAFVKMRSGNELSKVTTPSIPPTPTFFVESSDDSDTSDGDDHDYGTSDSNENEDKNVESPDDVA